MARNKVIVAVDVGHWDRVMYTAATIASALRAFQSPGLRATGNLLLCIPRDIVNLPAGATIERFVRSTAGLLDLPLRRVMGEAAPAVYRKSPNEGVLMHVAADPTVDGLLQVKPGIIVTPELIEVAAKAKVLSALSGRYAFSPLHSGIPAGRSTDAHPRVKIPESDAVVDNHDVPLTTYSDRAVIFSPNFVELFDHDGATAVEPDKDTPDNPAAFLSTVPYFHRKVPTGSGLTGAIDVPVGDIVKPLDQDTDLRYPEVFPYGEWLAADTPEADYRFIMGWIRDSTPEEVFGTAHQSELFQILRVFFPLTTV